MQIKQSGNSQKCFLKIYMNNIVVTVLLLMSMSAHSCT